MTTDGRQELESQLSAYLDGELTPEERERVEAGLADDAELRARLEQLRATVEAVKSLPRAHVPEDFMDGLRARLERRALLGEDEPPARPADVSGPFPGRWLAAAAVIALTFAAAYFMWPDARQELASHGVGDTRHLYVLEESADRSAGTTTEGMPFAGPEGLPPSSEGEQLDRYFSNDDEAAAGKADAGALAKGESFAEAAAPVEVPSSQPGAAAEGNFLVDAMPVRPNVLTVSPEHAADRLRAGERLAMRSVDAAADLESRVEPEAPAGSAPAPAAEVGWSLAHAVNGGDSVLGGTGALVYDLDLSDGVTSRFNDTPARGRYRVLELAYADEASRDRAMARLRSYAEARAGDDLGEAQFDLPEAVVEAASQKAGESSGGTVNLYEHISGGRQDKGRERSMTEGDAKADGDAQVSSGGWIRRAAKRAYRAIRAEPAEPPATLRADDLAGVAVGAPVADRYVPTLVMDVPDEQALEDVVASLKPDAVTAGIRGAAAEASRHEWAGRMRELQRGAPTSVPWMDADEGSASRRRARQPVSSHPARAPASAPVADNLLRVVVRVAPPATRPATTSAPATRPPAR